MSAIPSVAEILGADVARLYEAKSKLAAAASNPVTMSGELPTYQIVLSSVKGSEQVKQLAASVIPQFLHYFPTLVESGINAQIDLVEDEKLAIRLHAIRGLEMICKHNPSTVRKIADLLAQLLVSEEKVELACVHTTFASLFSIDAAAAFLSLFSLVSTGADASLRAKGLEFLQQQLKALGGSLRKDEAASAAVSAGLKAMLGTQNALLGKDELKSLVQTLIALSPHGNTPAKIKADDAFKAELGAIAAAQAGIAGGQLDLSNEAAVKHFLALQSVVGNLASQYGVDTAPFLGVYLRQVLPNLDSVANAELRTQLLRAVAGAAARVSPKQAQAAYPAFYAQFKKHIPTGEIVAKAPAAASAVAAAAPAAAASADVPASASAAAVSASAPAPSSNVNFAFVEVLLYLFHVLSAGAPSELRAATGIFTPTGQPGDFGAEKSAAREEFSNRVQYTLQCNAAYKDQLHAVQRAMQEELNILHKSAADARKEAAQAAKAAKGKKSEKAAGATGQPGEEKKESEEMSDAAAAASPAAAAAAGAPSAEVVAASTLKSKLSSVNFAVRIAASIAALGKPLLERPLPTLLGADKMALSWRDFKSGPQQGGQQGGGGKGNQQSGKGQQGGGGGKGQQQKGGNQQQQRQGQGQGQKRKSDGGAQSNKKQGGGGGGNQQGNQQGGQSKKQRQSQSNKGGNGGGGGGNQNGGGGRRRR